MRAGEDSQEENATFGTVAVEPITDVSAGDLEAPRDGSWRMMASAAAGTMFGMPVPTGTFRAVWIEVSRWIAALQR